jgi:hypothetical protein
VAWLAGQVQARRRTGTDGIARRLFAVEHGALLLAIVTGFFLMSLHGWRLSHPRWLGLKVGLVVFLLVPLEGFHAFVCHAWLPQARRWGGVMGERRVERGIGMEEMIRTLAIPLLGMAVPLLVWLSFKRPF